MRRRADGGQTHAPPNSSAVNFSFRGVLENRNRASLKTDLCSPQDVRKYVNSGGVKGPKLFTARLAAPWPSRVVAWRRVLSSLGSQEPPRSCGLTARAANCSREALRSALAEKRVAALHTARFSFSSPHLPQQTAATVFGGHRAYIYWRAVYPVGPTCTSPADLHLPPRRAAPLEACQLSRKRHTRWKTHHALYCRSPRLRARTCCPRRTYVRCYRRGQR